MSLLLLAPIVLASGIVQEYLHGRPLGGIDNTVWTGLHIAVSAMLTALVAWHVYLNWRGVSNWYRRFKAHRSPGIKITVIFYLLTVASGIIVVPLWLHCGHGGIGGLHGKIGFVSALCILLHIIRHRRWYTANRTKQSMPKG